ncbi:succinate dehydrogenase, hydrophobic membrane anchor protein [Epibacterium sp. MM17-32]|jgi:succinate dehydrogenase / fumarate reductase membrane anchor subunit|uniref:succinate dehydrogenase, hydrophobic membrane anchor protein n=1 Tax=Epibacterium sp. MM17-32 TaxID=2917734 RepID=UPI001EF60560|nr:succinate dehydrogenase, hydrophobic membrane anchor protein [Epibacterium sp. MM17-32]MCG7626999.1 succinate dehydrogenase, hydrophobic membrane anchor protein [Epibacterium sp. MM17-32]
MRFLTDRKRAEGLGAGGTGTHHHWQMMVTSILLVVLVPAFVITFGLGLGGTYEEVLAYYARPLPAIITGLTLVVGVIHLMRETQVAVEDYVHGLAGKLLLIAVAAFSYTLIAAGLFALVKLAL